jgi:hypothetical protein
MRLHRIELRNYRGVGSSSVTFPTSGVTIVEGDNEVGKSSLAEALDLILDAPDSSKSAKVRSVQPVHRDVGPEVTVELSTGPYRFVYSKRWHRRPETTLEILEPRHEHLRGREAHQRVQAILDETLDADLWSALRLTQAGDLAQPTFHVTSLGRALDAAAGAERSGDREDALWERICAERDRYVTATGQTRGDRIALAHAVDAARERVTAVEAQLASLDADAEEVARLDVDAADLERQLADRAVVETELAERSRLVDQRRGEVARLSAEHAAAAADHERWEAARARRSELVDDARRCADEVAKREAETERARPAQGAARAHLAAVEADAARARTVLAEAEAAHQRAVADSDHRRHEIELEQLTERHDRVVEAQARIHEAEARLETIEVDAASLARIEEAHLGVVRAEAAVSAGAAMVEIAALAEFTVEVDGVTRTLAPGATEEHAVSDALVATVPGVAELRVRAGAESRALAAQLAAARHELAARCAEVAVDDVDHARRLAADRVEAERTLADAAAAVQRDLRDLTLGELAQKIERLARRTIQYRDDRPDEPPLPPDLGAAQALAAQTERALDGLAHDVERCEAILRHAAEAVVEAEKGDSGLAILLDQARLASERAERVLSDARAERSDEALAAAADRAARELEQAAAGLATAERDLAAEDPDSLEAMLANARAVRVRVADQLDERRRRRQELRMRLDLLGEQGLAQQLDDATTELQHLEREHERTERRAAAALHLYDTFAARRDQARDTYSAPFRSRIEQLGRIVWGPGFEVELDDELRIARRTLDGITVDFDDLSTGAREQLGIIARLACASIVSADGGAPVVIDDALGWTDPHRLERIGAAIAVAGRDCQVIVLTCTPGRYASVGNASVVRLTPTAA